MSRIPLYALQGFVAVSRSGTISRAAASMNVTVSALSHQLRHLEANLGYTLLIRQSRGVQLTPEGKRLLEQVGPHLDAITAVFQSSTSDPHRLVTLSALPSMATAWLAPRLGSFVETHPEVEMRLQSSDRLVDFERQAQFDGALRAGLGNWPGLIVEPLLEEWFVPMASPGLIEKMGGVTAKPLEQWPLLGKPNSEWELWFALTGGIAPTRYVAVLDDSESHHRAAVEGVGVALATLTRSLSLLNSGHLVALSEHRLKAAWAHWLVYPERSKTHRGFQAFRQWIHAQAEQFRLDSETLKPSRTRRKKRQP